MIAERLVTNLFTAGLKKFRDRHRGESAYIFGDGPSIKWFDLESFAHLPAICCGMMPFHKDFHKLDVRYATFIAPWIFLPPWLQPRMYRGWGEIAAEYRRVISATPRIQFFVNLSNRCVVRDSNVSHVYRGLPGVRNDTDRLLRSFNLFDGSFHAALSLAYYMGFKRIFLVGFDAWTIEPARNLHWYELGEGERFEPTNFATEFLGVLRREMEILTVGMDGSSRNVAHVTYQSHTGRLPKFRENHELMDERRLKLLATFPEYRIFAN